MIFKIRLALIYTAITWFSMYCYALAQEYEYFSILAEAMNPVDSTIQFDCHEGYLKTTTDSALHSSQYIAQVNLTQGAEILNAKCYGYDNDSNNFTFAVFRYRFNGEGNNTFEQITSFGDSGNSGTSYVELTVGTIANPSPPGIPIINNQDYSYGLYLNLPAASSGSLYVVRCLVEARLPEQQSVQNRTVVVPLLE